MKMDGRLQINLLGKPEVWLDGERLTSFSTAKTEALLYYLAASGALHSRESLAGLLWSGMPETKARRNLTKSLTVLRRLLEPFLVIEPQRVGFDAKMDFELDVAHFTSAVAQSPLSPDVTTLYRGDFLDGFFVKDAIMYDGWQLTQRERYREMAVEALELLVEQAGSRQAYVEGTAYARRLLELDPWRESAHRALMLLLARCGQHAAALAQYEQCRQVLADELGVEPMPETSRLFRRIQQARQARPYQLPADSTPFVGRQDELAALGRLLSDPACRLLTLTGLGGMGKTRLALAAGRQANREQGRQFLHGVVFVSLAAVASADLLPAAVADELELTLAGRQEPAGQLSQFLRDKEMLLVLDNFEHMLRGTAVLNHLLQACPDVKFLVTSRESLQIDAEHRFEVGGLPFPGNGQEPTVNNQQLALINEDGAAADYPAIQLFLQTARQVKPDFEMTAETVGAVVHICRTLAGMPLAIKLAASWLRALPCPEIAAEIDRGLDLLATTMRDIPARQRSMAAVFDQSWQMLTAGEQTALAGLSVFRGGFTAEAAKAVVNASLLSLAGLIDRSLLNLEETAEGGRYFLHELTRQYAAEKLAQSPETAAAIRTAHRRYYAHHLAKLAPALSGKTPQLAYTIIHREIGNVRRAWQSALDTLDVDSLTHLMEPLAQFYSRQGWFAEGQERMEAAVQAIQSAGLEDKAAVRLRGGLLARQGLLMGRIGQFAAAESVLSQSIEKARQIGDPHLLALSLLELGRLLRDQSRFEEAAEAIEECYDIAVELDDHHLIPRAMEKLGVITWDQGSHKEAKDKLVEALAHFRALPDTRRAANTLNSLGNVVMSMGDNQTALVHYQEALPILRELEDWLMLDTVLINLGMVTNNLGDYEQSRRYYEESLEICGRIGDEIGVAYCLTGIGLASMAAGDYVQARQLIEQSLAINREMERERYVGINLYLLGDVALKQGERAEARACYEESLEVSKAIPHPWGMASSALRLGDLELLEGNEPAASSHYLEALSLGVEMEAEGIVMTALTNLAAQLLKREAVETAVFVLLTVQKQPSITDSLGQTIAELLSQEVALLSPSVQAQVGSKAGEVALEAAIAKIQDAFASPVSSLKSGI